MIRGLPFGKGCSIGQTGKVEGFDIVTRRCDGLYQVRVARKAACIPVAFNNYRNAGVLDSLWSRRVLCLIQKFLKLFLHLSCHFD